MVKKLLGRFKEVPIPFADHTGGSKQILDDEYGNVPVHRNHQRTLYTWFRVNEVITFLSVKAEPIPLKYPDELLEVDRP